MLNAPRTQGQGQTNALRRTLQQTRPRPPPPLQQTRPRPPPPTMQQTRPTITDMSALRNQYTTAQAQVATAEILNSWVEEDGCDTIPASSAELFSKVTSALETMTNSVAQTCPDGFSQASRQGGSLSLEHLCTCTDFGILRMMADAVESGSVSCGLFSDAVVLTELTVGVLLSVYTCSMLLPASLSLLSGVAAALLNLKLFVPTSALLGMLGISTSTANIPMCVVLLAMIYQTVGNSYFGAALWLAVLYLSGFAILRPQKLLEGNEMDAFKVRMHMYTVKGFQLISAVMCIYCFSKFWTTSRIIGTTSIDLRSLFTSEMILAGLVSFIASSLLSNVAMMDWVTVHAIRVHDHERGLAFSRDHAANPQSPSPKDVPTRMGSFVRSGDYKVHVHQMEMLREAAIFPMDRTADPSSNDHNGSEA